MTSFHICKAGPSSLQGVLATHTLRRSYAASVPPRLIEPVPNKTPLKGYEARKLRLGPERVLAAEPYRGTGPTETSSTSAPTASSKRASASKSVAATAFPTGPSGFKSSAVPPTPPIQQLMLPLDTLGPGVDDLRRLSSWKRATPEEAAAALKSAPPPRRSTPLSPSGRIHEIITSNDAPDPNRFLPILQQARTEDIPTLLDPILITYDRMCSGPTTPWKRKLVRRYMGLVRVFLEERAMFTPDFEESLLIGWMSALMSAQAEEQGLELWRHMWSQWKGAGEEMVHDGAKGYTISNRLVSIVLEATTILPHCTPVTTQEIWQTLRDASYPLDQLNLRSYLDSLFRRAAFKDAMLELTSIQTLYPTVRTLAMVTARLRTARNGKLKTGRFKDDRSNWMSMREWDEMMRQLERAFPKEWPTVMRYAPISEGGQGIDARERLEVERTEEEIAWEERRRDRRQKDKSYGSGTGGRLDAW